MHLVSTLVAGVKGAENGTAEIYERGTTVRADYWLDFEGVTAITTGLDVALDSFGGATVYVSELCTVLVKTVGGAVLRSFVAGVSDSAVEVVSPSFTGVNYVTAQGGPNEPTTLESVLDRWTTVNGGTDWRVLIPGTGMPSSGIGIGDAIAGSYGLVVNVKTYGAVGNGVANDTVAINSAITATIAAGGGIVYFPAGTYRTTGGHSHVGMGDVLFIGAGPAATAIVLDNPTATKIFGLHSSTTADQFQVIANMRLSAASLTPANIFDVVSDTRTIFYNLYLDGRNLSAAIVDSHSSAATEVMFTSCVFLLGSTAPGVETLTNRRILFRDSKFVTPASFSADAVIKTRAVEVTGCSFQNTATTTGTYACVKITTDAADMRVIGCKFLNAAGATVTAMDFGTYDNTAQVSEVGNTFGTTINAYAYTATAAARGSRISLQTREMRSLHVVDATAAATPVTLTLPIDQYGLITVSCASDTITFQATKQPPDGARGSIVLFHAAGGIGGTAIMGANFLNPGNIVTNPGSGHIWEYRVCTPNATVRMALSVDGRNLGTAM